MPTFKKRALLSASVLILGLMAACAEAATPQLPAPADDAPLAGKGAAPQTLVVAGGCFWGVEAVFEHTKGVIRAVSGYAGGTKAAANYDAVSTGTTQHAEAVEITYDPAAITPGTLLKVFFSVAHDPTQVNRQGPDTGPQYRSAIFTIDDAQARIVNSYIAQLDAAGLFRDPIATKVAPLEKFYPAEDYHQDYLVHHMTQPYIVYHDLPKLKALETAFPGLYVDKK